MTTTPLPHLECGPDAGPLADLYASALRTLVDVNVVGTGANRLIRAGGGYATPWTRDAAINSWYAASLLLPDVARQTLLSVCEAGVDQPRLIAQDDQWWDQIIWAVAAWHHFVVTGDLDFLAEAYPIARDSAAVLNATRFDASFGLYRGPAVMQDGISGFPAPPEDPAIKSSFVLDYPDAATIMCLSTNAVYSGAHRAIARMAAVLGADPAPHIGIADALAAAVNRHLWREAAGTYGYFLHGPGPRYGEVDTHQEGLGLALAVLFAVADERRRNLIYATTYRRPYGVVNVWPSFPRYDTDHPGRHNAICWPMVMGVWADAAGQAERLDAFAVGLSDLVRLFTKSDNQLYELYNATTGAVDGGWQQGRQWESQPDQTWSATTFLGLIHHRLVGLQLSPAGLALRPLVPARWGPLTLRGIAYRDATLDITVTGAGSGLRSVSLDGKAVPITDSPVVVPSTLTGHHEVVAEVAPV